MALTHVEWIGKLHEGIGWARARLAERWHGLVGVVAEYVTEGARQALLARMPSFAEPAALERLADESGVPRIPIETIPQLRRRVQQRWDLRVQHGTRQVLERILAAYSEAGAPLRDALLREAWQLYPTPLAYWSRWYVLYTSDQHDVPLVLHPLGSAGCELGSVTLGGETPQDIVRSLRNLLRAVKRASTVGRVILASGDPAAAVLGFGPPLGTGVLGGPAEGEMWITI